MPRISHPRPPAEPTTAEQRERVERILEAAVAHGAAKGMERMQMTDVAKDAGVAIATLYRYFPSKTALFVGVLRSRLEELGTIDRISPPGTEAWKAIACLLKLSCEEMMASPLLSRAMLASNNASVIENTGGPVDNLFQGLLLREAEIAEPTPGQMRLLRLVEQAYFGILMSALNGYINLQQAQEDTTLACELLLGGLPEA